MKENVYFRVRPLEEMRRRNRIASDEALREGIRLNFLDNYRFGGLEGVRVPPIVIKPPIPVGAFDTIGKGHPLLKEPDIDIGTKKFFDISKVEIKTPILDRVKKEHRDIFDRRNEELKGPWKGDLYFDFGKNDLDVEPPVVRPIYPTLPPYYGPLEHDVNSIFGHGPLESPIERARPFWKFFGNFSPI